MRTAAPISMNIWLSRGAAASKIETLPGMTSGHIEMASPTIHDPERPEDDADRRLHPAIDGQDPEGGYSGADGDHQRRGEVQLLPYLVHAEQHHTEETRLEEEGGQHLIRHERPGTIREKRPVGAELIGHHNAGNDAHRGRPSQR